MDTWTLRVFYGLGCLVHVIGDCPRQRGNDWPINFFGDVGNCLKVTWGASGKAGLNDIYLHSLKLAGDLHLLFAGHANTGRLLSVAESCVQEQYSFFSHLYYLIPFCN